MKILLVLFLFISSISQAQNNNQVWFFGDGNFIDFNPVTPIISSAGTEVATATSTYCIEGSSSICNATGQLMFYSDGKSVWDNTFTLMPNGINLNGNLSNAQVLIVPNPVNQDIYYVFYNDYAGNANGFSYSEIDMSLNGGLGDVTINKNIQLHTPSSEHLKAITHCNGTDIWIISHDALGSTYRAYLVTATGVSNTAVISSIGTSINTVFEGMAYMTCSKEGTKIATNIGTAFDIIDFDNQTGMLCNPVTVNTGGFGGYGIEYSEDGTKLYVSDFTLDQYDVSSGNSATILASKINLGVNEPAAVMRGPNDKIYVATGCDWYDQGTSTMFETRKIHVINDPNFNGAACNLQQDLFTTPRECGLGLPTCYYPTQNTNTCGPVLNAEFTSNSVSICIDDCVTFTNISTGPSVSYEWTFAGGVPSNFSGMNPPDICYNAAGVFLATLIIEDCAGQTSQFSFDITVDDCTGPNTDISATQTTICSGDCIDYTDLTVGTNLNTWTWSFPGANITNSFDQNPTGICYDIPGSYNVTLEVTDDFGTTTETFVDYIIVNACIAPEAQIFAPDTICVGSCVNMQDLSLNNPDAWNWSFSGSQTLTSTNQNPQNICFLAEGTFQINLEVSNIYGVNALSKNIVVINGSSAGQDNSILNCELDDDFELTDLLINSFDLSGYWNFEDNIYNSTLFSPLNSGPGTYEFNYIMETTIAQGVVCYDTAIISIEIGNYPNAGLDGDLLLCDNNGITNLITGLNGVPDLGGVWTPSTIAGGGDFTPSVDNSGIYTYIVGGDPICDTDSARTSVTIIDLSNLEITTPEFICLGDETYQFTTNIDGGEWTGEGIIDSSTGLFSSQDLTPNTYTINYYIETENCSNSVENFIEFHEVPELFLGDDLEWCSNELLEITISEFDLSDNLIWYDGSSSSQNIITFDNVIVRNQKIVWAKVENDCGISIDSIVIDVIDCDVYFYVPNAFTPDGNSINNTFKPSLIAENLNFYTLHIYDRWGNVLFTSNNISQGWTGSNNGEIVKDGVYVWEVIFGTSISSYKYEYKGHVTVIK
jgi:gliding motility-associated-like protein